MEQEIRKYIFNELSKLNFKKETKGFKYLNEAIFLSIIDENAMENLSVNIFPKIAEKYHTKTEQNVKWCINGAIDTMYYNTDIKLLCQYFKLEKYKKPTAKYIIYFIVCKYLREENKQ